MANKRLMLSDAAAQSGQLLEFEVQIKDSEDDPQPETVIIVMRRPTAAEIYALERDIIPRRPVPDASNSRITDVKKLANGTFTDVYDWDAPVYKDQFAQWGTEWECRNIIMCLPEDDQPAGDSLAEQIETLKQMPNVYFKVYQDCAARAIAGGKREIKERPFLAD